jgi:hypothetical protein
MAVANLSSEHLRELVHYEPETGVFTWIKRRRGSMQPGKPAGSFNKDGYRKIQIYGESHLAHRLAWLYVHGEWPAERLDHKNRNKADNRIDNLRLSSPSLNSQNRSRADKDNRVGVLGVRARGRRFVAAITVDKKIQHLGTFDTVEMAQSAYLAAKRQMHQACTI